MPQKNPSFIENVTLLCLLEYCARQEDHHVPFISQGPAISPSKAYLVIHDSEIPLKPLVTVK